MSYKYIIGIDPSLTGTAVCQLGEDMEQLTYVFSSNACDGSPTARIGRYREMIYNIHQHIPWHQATAVYIEGYAFSRQGQGVRDTAEYGGMLRDKLVSEIDGIGLPGLVEVPPSVVKKFAAGKGNADKMQVAVALAKRYGVQFDSSDEYDAYAIARMGACIAGWCEPETEFQREAIDAVLHGKAKKPKRKSA